MYCLNQKIRDLTPYDPIAGEYKVRLDANESFLQPPEDLIARWKDILEEIPFNRYPDPTAEEVCRAFGEYYNIPWENVAAGNGSDELITVLFTGFLEKGDTFATMETDFSMYAFNGFLQEARHVVIPKNPDYTMDIDRTIEICNKENVKLLIFSNPCNPSSVVQTREEMDRLIRGVNGLVVLDEAYMDFSNQSLLQDFENYDNLIILRTCSKAIGMASLRLGFAVARDELIRAVKAVKSPYNVNTLTQKMGAALLQRKEMCRNALAVILESAKELRQGLSALGEKYPNRFTLIPGETNFAALSMEDGKEAFAFLESQGIAVRYTSNLLRITCGTKDENTMLLEAFEKYLNQR
jgi:histidinol-phosphate aminotransferase